MTIRCEPGVVRRRPVVMRRIIPLVIAALCAPLAASRAQADSGLEVRTVRFYRPETQQTQVVAFIRIPYGMMEIVPPGDGGPEHLSFTLTVRLRDAALAILYEQAWRKQVPPASPGRWNGLDMIRFSLDTGSYVFEALVQDSATDRTARRAAPVRAFPAPPSISDLLLSSEIRMATPGDSMPRPGVVRRGNMLLDAAAMVVLPRSMPVIHYLMETYLTEPESGSVTLRVVNELGEVVRVEPPAAVRVGDGVAVLNGSVDLAGLVPGAYSMAATVQLGIRTFTRDAYFWVVDGGPVVGARSPN